MSNGCSGGNLGARPRNGRDLLRLWQGDTVIIHRLIAARSVAGGLARLAIAGTLVASGALVMAQAAQASWLQVSLPQLGAGTNSGLSDISCTSATVCMAVGTSQG